MKFKFKTQYILLFLTAFLVGFILLYMYVRQIEQISVKNTHTIQQMLCIQEDLGNKMNEMNTMTGKMINQALQTAVNNMSTEVQEPLKQPIKQPITPPLEDLCSDIQVERITRTLTPVHESDDNNSKGLEVCSNEFDEDIDENESFEDDEHVDEDDEHKIHAHVAHKVHEDVEDVEDVEEMEEDIICDERVELLAPTPRNKVSPSTFKFGGDSNVETSSNEIHTININSAAIKTDTKPPNPHHNRGGGRGGRGRGRRDNSHIISI